MRIGEIRCADMRYPNILTVGVVVGKIWDGMGYRGVVPYHGMVWDIGLRSHTVARMVWVLTGMSHGMGYPWNVL